MSQALVKASRPSTKSIDTTNMDKWDIYSYLHTSDIVEFKAQAYTKTIYGKCKVTHIAEPDAVAVPVYEHGIGYNISSYPVFTDYIVSPPIAGIMIWGKDFLCLRLDEITKIYKRIAR